MQQNYKTILALFPFTFGTLVHAQDGTLDASFDGDGIVTTNYVAYDDANAVILQPDGKIVIGGTSGYEDERNFSLVRYLPDGTLDESFSEDGRTFVSIAAGNDIGTALALQEDGRILLGGYSYLPEGISFVLTRFTADGDLDTTFGDAGIVIPYFGDGLTSIGRGLALQADGKILMAGGGVGGFALVRFLPDGEVDETFDLDGLALCAFDGTSSQANDVAVQPDGYIVLTGYSAGGDLDSMALARFDPNGDLDPAFGNGGKYQATLPNGAIGRALSLCSDGKIMVAGASTTHAAVARFTADGQLDGSFFGSGITIINVLPSTLSGAYDVVALPDGRSLVCGSVFEASNDFLLVRFEADGNLDQSFDGDGRVSTEIAGTGDFAHAMALQPDGAIVLAGSSDGGSQDVNFAVTRYLASPVLAIDDRPIIGTTSVYPSPITAGSTLEYTLLERDLVNIDLLDARGAIVERLATGVLRQPGVHKVILDLRQTLAPGVYSLLVHGRTTRTQALVVVM